MSNLLYQRAVYMMFYFIFHVISFEFKVILTNTKYMPLYLFCKYLSIYKKDSYLMILNFN